MGCCLSTKKGVVHLDQEETSRIKRVWDQIIRKEPTRVWDEIPGKEPTNGCEGIPGNEHTEFQKSMNESDNLWEYEHSIASESGVRMIDSNELSSENNTFEHVDLPFREQMRRKRKKRKAEKKKRWRLFDIHESDGTEHMETEARRKKSEKQRDRKIVWTIIDKHIEPDAKNLISKVQKSPFNLTHMSLDSLKEKKGNGIDSIIIFQIGGTNANRGQDVITDWRTQIPNVISIIVVCIGYDVREDDHETFSCQNNFRRGNDIILQYHVNKDTKLPLKCSAVKHSDIIMFCQQKLVASTSEKTTPGMTKVVPSTSEKTTPGMTEVVPSTSEKTTPGMTEVVPSISEKTTPGMTEKWRQDGYEKWDDKTVKDLRGTIIEHSETLGAVDQIVIIVCGGTGHGKSSLINNCMAALKGSYFTITRVGRGPELITKQYKQFQSVTMDDGRERKLPLIFADTRGFSESKREGASVAAIQACIMGKVANGETIDPNITEKEWREKKPAKSKVAYIFFVADATVIGGEAKRQTLIRNLREIREFAKVEDIPVSAFVTKCDNLDPAVKDDPSILHYSKAVQGVVTLFSPMIDVPVNRVFPVVNYTDQFNPSNEMMIQTLLALKNCMEDIVGDIHSHID